METVNRYACQTQKTKSAGPQTGAAQTVAWPLQSTSAETSRYTLEEKIDVLKIWAGTTFNDLLNNHP